MRRSPAESLRIFLVAFALAGCDDAARQQLNASREPASLDMRRDRVWSLSDEGVRVHPRAAPQKAVLVPLPGWIWAGPPYGCLPTLALGPKGEAVVSSDIVPTLWR